MIKTTSDKITFPKKKGGYVLDYNEYFEMRDTDWMSSKDDEYSRTYRCRPEAFGNKERLHGNS